MIRRRARPATSAAPASRPAPDCSRSAGAESDDARAVATVKSAPPARRLPSSSSPAAQRHKSRAGSIDPVARDMLRCGGAKSAACANSSTGGASPSKRASRPYRVQDVRDDRAGSSTGKTSISARRLGRARFRLARSGQVSAPLGRRQHRRPRSALAHGRARIAMRTATEPTAAPSAATDGRSRHDRNHRQHQQPFHGSYLRKVHSNSRRGDGSGNHTSRLTRCKRNMRFFSNKFRRDFSTPRKTPCMFHRGISARCVR